MILSFLLCTICVYLLVLKSTRCYLLWCVLFTLICWYWSQHDIVFSGVYYLHLFVSIEVNKILSFLVFVICTYLLVLKSTGYYLFWYVLFVLICWYWSQQDVIFSGMYYLCLFVGIEVNRILSFLMCIICAYLLVLKSTRCYLFWYVLFVLIRWYWSQQYAVFSTMYYLCLFVAILESTVCCLFWYVLFVLICWYWSQQYVVFSGVYYLCLFVSIEVNKMLFFLVCIICVYLLVLKSRWCCCLWYVLLCLFVNVSFMLCVSVKIMSCLLSCAILMSQYFHVFILLFDHVFVSIQVKIIWYLLWFVILSYL